jgi:hypothetical protein
MTQRAADGLRRKVASLTAQAFPNPYGLSWELPMREVIVAHRSCMTSHVKHHRILREEADTMFYWACRAGGCSFSHASLLYTGVRIGAYVFPTEYADSVPEGIPGDDAFALGARRVPELLRETTMDRQQVAKYYEIAEKLRDLDDDFESVKNAVDKMLKAPRR